MLMATADRKLPSTHHPLQLTSIRERWGSETVPYCQVEFQTAGGAASPECAADGVSR